MSFHVEKNLRKLSQSYESLPTYTSSSRSNHLTERRISDARLHNVISNPTFKPGQIKWKKGVSKVLKIVKRDPASNALNHYSRFKEYCRSRKGEHVAVEVLLDQFNEREKRKIPEPTQLLSNRYWLELLDPQHRYGKILNIHWQVWARIKSPLNFFTWLNAKLRERTVEDSKIADLYREIWKKSIDKQTVPFKDWRKSINSISKVIYLNEKERKRYIVKIQDGKLYNKETGNAITTNEHGLIFVRGYDNRLYAGPYVRGTFHHSSFLSGRRVKAAGELFCNNGKLVKITDLCGHYYSTHPLKNLEQMWYFLDFLNNQGVNLKEVLLEINAHAESKYNTITWDASLYHELQFPVTVRNGNKLGKIPLQTKYLGRVGKEIAKKTLLDDIKITRVIRHVSKEEELGRDFFYEIFFRDQYNAIRSKYMGKQEIQKMAQSYREKKVSLERSGLTV